MRRHQLFSCPLAPKPLLPLSSLVPQRALPCPQPPAQTLPSQPSPTPPPYSEPRGTLQMLPERLQKPLAALAGHALPKLPHVLHGNRDAPQPFALARKCEHHTLAAASARLGHETIQALPQQCLGMFQRQRRRVELAVKKSSSCCRSGPGRRDSRSGSRVNPSVVDACPSLTSSAV